MHYHIERASSAISAFFIYPVRSTNMVLYHNSKLKRNRGALGQHFVIDKVVFRSCIDILKLKKLSVLTRA